MKKQMLVLLAAGAMLVGCDRREQVSSSTGSRPTTQPVRTESAAPSTQPVDVSEEGATADAKPASSTASPQPAGASFVIADGTRTRMYDFPRARLRLTKEGDKYAAVLYSDDPKAAIKNDYTGNSFFLRMTLDIDDPSKLSGADWQYHAPSSERQETADGIFLDGTHVQLQPADIAAVIQDQQGKTVNVVVWGQFLKFDSDQPNAPAMRVGVRGEFAATVEVVK